MEETATEVSSPDDGGGATRSARARKALLLFVAVLGGTALVLGGRHLVYGQYIQSTNNAFVQTDSVTVSPKVAGYVEQVFVENNQTVRKGQPLARIDLKSYRAIADQNRAQVTIAEASAAAYEAQVLEQQAAVERARADLSGAQSDLGYARDELARYEPLVRDGAETRERLEQLRQQARQADTKLAAARSVLSAAQRRIETLNAQVRQARAQGQAASAQLRSAQDDVDATLLRASIDGRVGDRTIREGQYVQAATRLMSIIPAQQVYVEANFKETQVGAIRVGQPVKVEIDALPGLEIPGRVASISPGTGSQFSILPPQNATGNFTKIVQRVPVRISLVLSPTTRAFLVSGMSAEVAVDTRSARKAAGLAREEQERLNAQATR